MYVFIYLHGVSQVFFPANIYYYYYYLCMEWTYLKSKTFILKQIFIYLF